MDNYITVVNMGMVKESIAREKSEEQDQEKVPGYVNAASLQMSVVKIIQI
jgi:hypothetical protein